MKDLVLSWCPFHSWGISLLCLILVVPSAFKKKMIWLNSDFHRNCAAFPSEVTDPACMRNSLFLPMSRVVDSQVLRTKEAILLNNSGLLQFYCISFVLVLAFNCAALCVLQLLLQVFISILYFAWFLHSFCGN